MRVASARATHAWGIAPTAGRQPPPAPRCKSRAAGGVWMATGHAPPPRAVMGGGSDCDDRAAFPPRRTTRCPSSHAWYARSALVGHRRGPAGGGLAGDRAWSGGAPRGGDGRATTRAQLADDRTHAG